MLQHLTYLHIIHIIIAPWDLLFKVNLVLLTGNNFTIAKKIEVLSLFGKAKDQTAFVWLTWRNPSLINRLLLLFFKSVKSSSSQWVLQGWSINSYWSNFQWQQWKLDCALNSCSFPLKMWDQSIFVTTEKTDIHKLKSSNSALLCYHTANTTIKFGVELSKEVSAWATMATTANTTNRRDRRSGVGRGPSVWHSS